MGPQLASAVVLASLLLFLQPQPFAESGPVADGRPSLTELWTEPTNLDRLDLSVGRWIDRRPDPLDQFEYVRAKKHGASPGVKVRDGHHRTWHVKQGREAQPEVLMSRVLSAIGYRQPPVYYLDPFTLLTGSHPHVVRGGRFRLSDPSLHDVGRWQWADNPFVGTLPYQGLLVILVLLNSADLKDSNNTLYEIASPADGARRWYVVRDLGTSLGATNRHNPKPNDPSAFERRRFVTGIRDGYVEFDDYHAVHNEIVRRIAPADVRWGSALLARLTDRQWRQAFLAAGYDPSTADRYLLRIRQKIEEGRALGDRPVRYVGPMLP